MTAVEIDRRIMGAARALWRFHGLSMKVAPADAIVVLGSYDLRVARRGAELFGKGLAPRVLATGNRGHWTRDRFSRSEAEVFADELAARGVPQDRIILEPAATNIGENIAFARAALSRFTVGRAIFVTKPQTRRRTYATIRVQWPGIDAIVTAPAISFDRQPTSGHGLDDLIDEMVGDLFRIKDYPRRGWQVPQDVPRKVEDAYRFLVRAGFTRHIPEVW